MWSLRKQVVNQVKIEEVIGRYIDLKRVGKSYKALCPFHSEDTPSFFVSPERKIYKCFGCGATGDVIDFLMRFLKVNFDRAVKILVEDFNVQADTEKRKELNAYEELAKLYHEELYKHPEALKYLQSRGINEETVSQWQIGYAPTDRNLYLRILKRHTKFDPFAGRVVIPITDVGNVVGFIGRAIDGRNPKYLLSEENEFFKKSALLFGYDIAQQYIKEYGYVMLVEGPMDVILLHQHGFSNTVGLMGSSLSDEQAFLIEKATRNVVIGLDGDEAGRSGMFKAVAKLLKKDMDVRVLMLPDELDPADMCVKGMWSSEYVIENTITSVEYVYRTLVEIEPVNRTNRLALAKEFARYITNPATYDEYVQLISKREKLPVEKLYDYFMKSKDSKKRLFKKTEHKSEAEVQETESEGPTAEEVFVVMSLRHPDLLHWNVQLESPWEELKQRIKNNQLTDEDKQLLEQLQLEMANFVFPDKEYLYRRLRQKQLKRALASIDEKIKLASGEEKVRLVIEKTKLLKEMGGVWYGDER